MLSHHLTKLLLHQSQQDKGLALLGLLVVGGLGIWGSITASAAYSQQFLVRDFEARRYIGIINTAQLKYYLENQQFGTELADLKTGIPVQTDFYNYRVVLEAKGGFVTNQALPSANNPYVKAVIGGVAARKTSNNNVTLISTRCIAKFPPAQGGPKGTELMGLSQNGLLCPAGYQDLK